MAATTNMARRRKRDSDLSFGDMFSDVLWKGKNFPFNKKLKDVRCPSKTMLSGRGGWSVKCQHL